jgi:hypothetical protein
MTLKLTMLATLDATGVVDGAKDAQKAIAGLGETGTDVLTAQQEQLGGVAGGFKDTGAAAGELARTIPELTITLADIDGHSRGTAASLRDNARAIAEETLALEELQSAWSAVQRTGETAIRSLVTRLADGDLTGALRSVITEVSQLGLQLAAINPLTNALFGTARPTLGAAGGFLGGLFGSFDSGGSTGRGSDTEVAGLVHRNEYVFDAQSTRKIGVNTLEALRQGALRGYQDGGLVTTSAFSAPRLTQTETARSQPGPVQQTGDTFIMNIATPDIQSFRASRSQLAGEFARMNLRGGRNG